MVNASIIYSFTNIQLKYSKKNTNVWVNVHNALFFVNNEVFIHIFINNLVSNNLVSRILSNSKKDYEFYWPYLPSVSLKCPMGPLFLGNTAWTCHQPSYNSQITSQIRLEMIDWGHNHNQHKMVAQANDKVPQAST